MTAASVVIAGSLQMMFTVGGLASYSTIEDALVAQGFSDYSINRQVYPGSCDVTITLNPPTIPLTGIVQPFPAASTLTKLAAAAAKFGG